MTMKVQQKVAELQKQLHHLGFDPGVIDGVWGRRTQAAVRAFQAKHGLVVDGIVGPKTFKALFAKDMDGNGELDDQALVWFQEARRLKGVKETPGAASNRVILDWASGLNIPYSGDDVAWCGLFVAHCIGSTISSEPLPNNPLGARNWLKFGAPAKPTLGAILVFWRGSVAGWKGHVGFYAGESATRDAFLVLGGNQADKVSFAWISKQRFLGARWPSTVPIQDSQRLIVADGGDPLSDFEA